MTSLKRNILLGEAFWNISGEYISFINPVSHWMSFSQFNYVYLPMGDSIPYACNFSWCKWWWQIIVLKEIIAIIIIYSCKLSMFEFYLSQMIWKYEWEKSSPSSCTFSRCNIQSWVLYVCYPTNPHRLSLLDTVSLTLWWETQDSRPCWQAGTEWSVLAVAAKLEWHLCKEFIVGGWWGCSGWLRDLKQA